MTWLLLRMYLLMDEALELSDFLPVSFKTRSEGDYVAFLWDSFHVNYSSGKFEFASLAFHLLYMSFVSFSIWQIRLVREQDFKNALVGFQNDAEQSLLIADSPFKFYERLKESQIFRFLKLIGCGNEQVGEFAKFVRRRNKIAHPSGTVFFNDQVTLDEEIASMMKEVSNIQQHMRPIILEVYGRFLTDSANIEEREYAENDQQIEVALIHQSYVSQKDIEICLEFDVETLAGDPGIEGIRDLHLVLAETYRM
jgi:hypothetical protein